MSEKNIKELDLNEQSMKPKFNHIQRFIGIITKPQEVIEDISKNPKVLIPILLVSVLMSAITFLKFDSVVEIQRLALVEQTMKMGGQVPLDGFVEMSRSIAMATVLGSGIGVVVILLISALITHGISTFTSGEGSVKKLFSASLYISMVTMIGSLLSALVSMLLNIDILSFSPAILLDNSQVSTPLYAILSTVEVFNLWRLYLMMMAVRTIEVFTTKKASIIVVAMVVLGILIQISAFTMGR